MTIEPTPELDTAGAVPPAELSTDQPRREAVIGLGGYALDMLVLFPPTYYAGLIIAKTWDRLHVADPAPLETPSS